MAEVDRVFAVIRLSLRGSIGGIRAVGLGAFAAVPALLVLAIASARPDPGALAGSAEGLFAVLTLPIVTMVVVLVVAVAQFRNEIDSETLVYLSDRSVGRGSLVVGKYLGALGASLLFSVPAALAPLGIAEAGGAPAYPAAVPLAIALTAVVGTAAYVAVFLFLGLVTRSALVVGLLFGFLWEELLVLLPGGAPRLTLAFYLRRLLAGEVGSGPLAAYPSAVDPASALATLLGVVAAFLLFAIVVFRSLETAPARVSA